MMKSLTRRKMYKPLQLKDPDFTELKKICQEYIDSYADNGFVDDDLEHYIFEEALKAIFGEHVWQWIKEYMT